MSTTKIPLTTQPDAAFYRPCPHCGGKNTGYWIIGIEELEIFTTWKGSVSADGTIIRTLDACCDANRHRCKNLD